MAKKKKRKKSNVVLNIFIALVFLAGAGVFLYPTISDMWNQYRNAQLVSKYEEAVTELSDNDYDRLWKEAKEYNAEHPVNAIVDAFEEEDTYELSHPYDRVLDPNGDGLMGSIEIPKIKAKLAIYHGLSKTVLEKGVGHVRVPAFLSEARAPMRSGGASRSSECEAFYRSGSDGKGRYFYPAHSWQASGLQGGSDQDGASG